jgi:hypothetical protein
MSINFKLATSGLEVLPLQRALQAQPALFGLRDQRTRAYQGQQSPHKMSDIWARFNAWENVVADWDKARFEPHESVWYPEAAKIPQVRPIVFDLMRIVEGEKLGAVLITKVPPGGRIESHVDGGWHALHYSKFYVPIQNGKGAVFCWEDGCIDPALGEAYWFVNQTPHWVINDSDEDRIAMIVCIKTSLFPVNHERK